MFYSSMTSDVHSFYKRNSILKRSQRNAITKPVKLVLVTQRKRNITALQLQFYAFYFDQQSLYMVFKVKKNLLFPHLISFIRSYKQHDLNRLNEFSFPQISINC